MPIEKSKNIDFLKILSRLKEHTSLTHDWEVAKLLGYTKEAFSERKRRNSVPVDKLEVFCERESINIEWLLYGEWPKYREEKVMPGMINEPPAAYSDERLDKLITRVQKIYKDGDLSERAAIRGMIDEVYEKLIEKIDARLKAAAGEPPLKKPHAG